MKRCRAEIAIFVLLLWTTSAGAQAYCAGANPHQINSAEAMLDSIPPTAPVATVAGVGRGHGLRTTMGGPPIIWPYSTGSISLIVWGARDDRTDEKHMGYKVSILQGTLPVDFFVPEGAVRAKALDLAEFKLTLCWFDGGFDEQEPFSFVLAISAIDLGGNESELSDFVIVEDQGRFGAPKHPWR